MKIVVCIKQICQTYAQTGLDSKTHYLSEEDQILRINPYDEAALEIALKQKDKNRDIEIILLTLGSIMVEDELRRCLALGANDLYHIKQETFFDSKQKAEILARAIGKIKPDMILCGKESMDRQNGQVACFLARLLDQPFVSAIETLDISYADKTAVVQRRCGRGARQEVNACLPAVFSVDMGAFDFRMPKLKDQNRADIKVFHKVTGCIDEPVNTDIVTTSVSPPRPRAKKIPVPGRDMESFARIKGLLTGSQISKKTRILDGSIESQVIGIISFLKENGFLKTIPTQESK